MPEILLMKNFGKLEAVDPVSEAYLKGLSIGEIVKVKITKPRHGSFHRKVFSLLKLAFDNQDAFDDFDDFRKAVTIAAGFYRDRRMFDGSYMREAKSISYSAMDDLEFQRYFNEIFKVITELLGTDDVTLAQEVQQYLTIGG